MSYIVCRVKVVPRQTRQNTIAEYRIFTDSMKKCKFRIRHFLTYTFIL